MKTNARHWFDWFASIVLIVAICTVAIRLRVTDWTGNLEVIEFLVLFGSILGVMLGASQFTSLAVQLFALNYTIFFVPWQLGLIIAKNISWDERILSLIGRLNFSINEVASNRPIQDPLLFLTTMALLFWILAITAGYQLARHGKPWGPVFMIGLSLAIIDFYTPYQAFRDRYSAFFVFLVLVLVARMYLLHSRRDWGEKGIAVDPEIGFDLGRTVAFSGLILVVMAWNVPTLVDALTPGTNIQRALARQWDSVRNRFQNAVAGLQNPVSVVSDYYGAELALGTGGAQGDEIVFNAQVVNGRPPGVRLYWRARSFDYFDGTQWKTSQESVRSVAANEWPYKYPAYESRLEIAINFYPNVSTLRNIYTVGMPLQIGHSTDVLADPQLDGTSDVLAVIANPPARGGELIRERAWVSSPTVVQLKATTSNYPADVKNRYLQLPANMSPRVFQLARDITAGLTNPYDQVMAITGWLRKNIDYQLTIPSVPQNRDILEWFLFDLKQGYCNYYATSEVIMLRSLGIPARLAVGYAEGESEQQATNFIVRRRDSHAWPEVYFEKYGWIEFEPTAAQPSTTIASGQAIDNGNLNRLPFSPGVTDEEPTPGSGGGGAPLPVEPVSPVTIFFVIGTPLVIGLLIALGLWLQRSGRLEFLKIPLPILVSAQMENRGIHPPQWLRRWATHARLSPMEQMFSRFGWMLFLLGRRSQASQTPAERVAEIIAAAPNTREPAQAFLEEYHRQEYSRKPGNLRTAQLANQRLWLEVFIGAFRRLVNG